MVRAGATVSIGLARLGRAGAPVALSSHPPRIDGPEVQIERAPGVVEWWRSLELGLEQGVTIDARPAGRGPLHLDMHVGEGVTPARVDDDTIMLLDTEGVELARYAQLHIMDAAGGVVPGTMEVHEGCIRLRVDDRDAQYPIVVDPLLDLVGGRLADGIGGASVAISPDGSWAIVGDPDSNATRVYVRSGETWTRVDESPLPRDSLAVRFGASVDISSGGTHAVVGDPGFNGNQGRVHYFKRRRVGVSEQFEHHFVLVVEGGALEAGALFGASVALSDDAAHLVAGAPGDVHGLNSGTVRYYECFPSRTSGTMCDHRQVIAPEASGAGGSAFGQVAINGAGSVLAVGAPAHAGRGSVDVYTRSGSSFLSLQSLVAPSARSGENFGVSVATDGEWLLVGADRFGSTLGGRVIAYQRPGGTGRFGAGVQVGTGGTNDRLGISVAIATGSGARAVAGANTGGFVNMYERTGTAWEFSGRDTRGGELGGSVSINAAGTRVVAGAAGHDTAFQYRVYRRIGEPCSVAADCQDEFCVDGVCCTSACGGGAADCMACSMAAGGTENGTCTALSTGAAADRVCRPSRGVCDREETCSPADTNCPADQFRAGETCREVDPDRGCDAPELCQTGSPNCPADTWAPVGTPCREPAVDSRGCDVRDFCDGTSFECPDVFEAEGTICESSMGGCDLDDLCDGAGNCVTRVQEAGVVCNPAVLDVCDTPDVCDGLTIGCPPAFLADVECRAADGTCDAPEFCSGDSPSCPPDAVEAAGMVCRESSAACDPSEQCDGASGACPADVNSCEPSDDAGVPTDAALDDGGGADAGTVDAASGCGCHVPSGAGGLPLACVVLFGWVLGRRHR